MYYDFHIHSCLSPCAEDEMTPNNICQMALIKGLDIIAVTDHNSTKQLPAMAEAARELCIGMLFGAELESAEEVHVLALFRQLDQALYLEVLEEMRKAGPSLIMADHPECVWTDYSREDLIGWIRSGYRVSLERCDDLSGLQPPILKVAMLMEQDASQAAASIRERLAGRANVMAAGARWVDVVSNEADKGTALARLQSLLGISREETTAFGDNGNDIGMLKLAGHSYAVANARQEVKEAASCVIGPMREDAVLQVIRSWL